MVSLLTIFLYTQVGAQDMTKAPGWSAFEQFVFATDKDHQTNSLIIQKNDEIIFERYREGFTQETKQQIWSMTKSIAGLIIGKAISDNIISAQDPVHKYFPQAPRDIKINHLLNMVSGYDWNEGYEYNPVRSDVINMLYTEHYGDMASFAANKKLAHPAGSYFRYSSGTTNVLMGILSHRTMVIQI